MACGFVNQDKTSTNGCKEMMADKINHPSHYNSGKIEAIDVIEDWQLGFHLGNCVKYICRAKHAGNERDDLLKAHWK